MRRDAGTDAGPPSDLSLGRALTCQLDAQGAMRAAARHIACDPGATGATVVAIVEAWEAGLFSHVEESGGFISGLGAERGCEAWRCAAEAASCEAYAACLERDRRPGPCEPFTTRCEGASLLRCEPDGASAVALVDCASFGATCADGRCRLGDCAFGTDYYHLECVEGSLSLCDGAIRMDCSAWSPGSACTSFHIGGEVPTQWCSPSGESEYGAYSRPVECDGRTIRFVSVSTRAHALDCVASGYRGCDERGCTL